MKENKGLKRLASNRYAFYIIAGIIFGLIIFLISYLVNISEGVITDNKASLFISWWIGYPIAFLLYERITKDKTKT